MWTAWGTTVPPSSALHSGRGIRSHEVITMKLIRGLQVHLQPTLHLGQELHLKNIISSWEKLNSGASLPLSCYWVSKQGERDYFPSRPFLSLTIEPKILKHSYTRSMHAVLSGIATPQALRHFKIATFVNNLHSRNFIYKVEITSYHTTEGWKQPVPVKYSDTRLITTHRKPHSNCRACLLIRLESHTVNTGYINQRGEGGKYYLNKQAVFIHSTESQYSREILHKFL